MDVQWGRGWGLDLVQAQDGGGKAGQQATGLQRLWLRLAGGGARKAALVTLAIRVAGAALAYVAQVLMARWMGAFDYGIYSVVWTVVMILALFACLGFSSSPGRFIPLYRGEGALALLRGYLTASRVIVFLTACVIGAAVALMVLLLRPILDPAYVQPLMLAMLALPFFALAGVQDGIARAHDRPDLGLMPSFIWRPLLILLLLFLALQAGLAVDAATAVLAGAVASALVALDQLWRLNRVIGRQLPAGPRAHAPRLWLAVSLPMLLVEGFLQLVTSADVIMVSFWQSPDEVAVYFAASKTLALVHFIYFAVRAASAHRFAALHGASHEAAGRSAFEAYVRRAGFWTFWPSVGAAAVLIAAAPFLLALFGPGFEAGTPLIAVLLIGVLARASAGPADALLSMCGLQKACAAIYSGVFVLNVGLNLLLIPPFGLMGAAVATSLAITGEALALIFVARRRLGVLPFAPFAFSLALRREGRNG